MTTTGKLHYHPWDFQPGSVCRSMSTSSSRYVHATLLTCAFLTNCPQIPPWDCVASEALDDSRLAPPESEEETEVMTAIYNLANTVIANAASRSLTKYVYFASILVIWCGRLTV